jgi:hypothetical protein
MGEELEWRIHTPNFLKELADCGLDKKMGILKVPLNEFRIKLILLSQIAQEIDDPRLHLWCCQMTLYDQADPESKDYDPEIFNKLKAQIELLEIKK